MARLYEWVVVDKDEGYRQLLREKSNVSGIDMLVSYLLSYVTKKNKTYIKHRIERLANGEIRYVDSYTERVFYVVDDADTVVVPTAIVKNVVVEDVKVTNDFEDDEIENKEKRGIKNA